MNSDPAGRRSLVALLVLGFLAAACTPARGIPAAPPTDTPAVARATQTTAVSTVEAAALPTPTGSATPKPAASRVPVQVLAKGNLFIRRGPDLAFNPISILYKGDTALPNGRDVLSEWIRIPLPDDPSQQGWVSIMSGFTQLTGDVSGLPEIEPSDWPQLASLRNCTYHELLVQPLGVSLPEVFNFPENEVRVNPGTYTVLDVDVDGYPEVLRV